MNDIFFTIVYCIPAVALIATSIGAFLAWKTLRHTHEWNRRKAAADVNACFLAPHIQVHWQRIYEPVLVQKKLYADLQPVEQQSVRELLTFLEHIGIQINHHITDKDIVFDLLGGAWPSLYQCAQHYIADIRSVRDPLVFEHFVDIAQEFTGNSDALLKRLVEQQQAARKEGRKPPLG